MSKPVSMMDFREDFRLAAPKGMYLGNAYVTKYGTDGPGVRVEVFVDPRRFGYFFKDADGIEGPIMRLDWEFTTELLDSVGVERIVELMAVQIKGDLADYDV